jgi:hypothetical protein
MTPSIGHHFRFSVEANTPALQLIEVEQTIIGLETEKRLYRCLFFIGAGQFSRKTSLDHAGEATSGVSSVPYGPVIWRWQRTSS